VSVASQRICVAHLVRRSNPISAFRAFLNSYALCPAGATHDLLIIFKGFARSAGLAPYEALLQGVRHRRTFVSDFGFDMRPYLKIGREQPYQFFLFLNSFSRLLVPGWLELLFRHAGNSRVGLVGATGSLQSILSDAPVLRAEARLRPSILSRASLIALRHARYIVSIRRKFPAFPNAHVRTNAFLVSREVLEKVRCPPLLTKWSAYRFESGVHGMTRQIEAAGLVPLLAGADGRAYEPKDWPEARTFWISEQENLLVSDNQTRAYTEGNVALRERLAFFAWRRRPDGSPREDLPIFS
jgi:hypothetical protein